MRSNKLFPYRRIIQVGIVVQGSLRPNKNALKVHHR